MGVRTPVLRPVSRQAQQPDPKAKLSESQIAVPLLLFLRAATPLRIENRGVSLSIIKALYREDCTVEGEAEGQIRASPVSNVGFGESAGVTGKSSCCLRSALFGRHGIGHLSDFEALRHDIVAVDLKNRRSTVQI